LTKENLERDCGKKLSRTWIEQGGYDGSYWIKQIKTFDDNDRCEWVNVSSGTGSPGLFWTKSLEL